MKRFKGGRKRTFGNLVTDDRIRFRMENVKCGVTFACV